MTGRRRTEVDVEVAFRTNCNTDIRTYSTLLSETRGYTVDLHIWTTLSLLRDPRTPPVRHVARHRFAVLVAGLDRRAHVQLHVICELLGGRGCLRLRELTIASETLRAPETAESALLGDGERGGHLAERHHFTLGEEVVRIPRERDVVELSSGRRGHRHCRSVDSADNPILGLEKEQSRSSDLLLRASRSSYI